MTGGDERAGRSDTGTGFRQSPYVRRTVPETCKSTARVHAVAGTIPALGAEQPRIIKLPMCTSGEWGVGAHDLHCPILL